MISLLGGGGGELDCMKVTVLGGELRGEVRGEETGDTPWRGDPLEVARGRAEEVEMGEEDPDWKGGGMGPRV